MNSLDAMVDLLDLDADESIEAVMFDVLADNAEIREALADAACANEDCAAVA